MRGCDDDGGAAIQAMSVHRGARIRGRRQLDAALTIGLGHPLHSTMGENGSDRRIESGDQPLRLPQGVSEKQAGLSDRGIGLPPRIDLLKDLRLWRPPVYRQAEGGLSDEGVAAHRLEWRAGWIGVGLVIAGDHPDLTVMGDSDLRR